MTTPWISHDDRLKLQFSASKKTVLKAKYKDPDHCRWKLWYHLQLLQSLKLKCKYFRFWLEPLFHWSIIFPYVCLFLCLSYHICQSFTCPLNRSLSQNQVILSGARSWACTLPLPPPSLLCSLSAFLSQWPCYLCHTFLSYVETGKTSPSLPLSAVYTVLSVSLPPSLSGRWMTAALIPWKKQNIMAIKEVKGKRFDG